MYLVLTEVVMETDPLLSSLLDEKYLRISH